MSVEFDEDVEAPRMRRPEHVSVLTRIVLKTGLAKTAQAAQKVLLVVAVCSFAGALLVFFDLGRMQNPPLPVPNANWP